MKRIGQVVAETLGADIIEHNLAYMIAVSVLAHEDRDAQIWRLELDDEREALRADCDDCVLLTYIAAWKSEDEYGNALTWVGNAWRAVDDVVYVKPANRDASMPPWHMSEDVVSCDRCCDATIGYVTVHVNRSDREGWCEECADHHATADVWIRSSERAYVISSCVIETTDSGDVAERYYQATGGECLCGQPYLHQPCCSPDYDEEDENDEDRPNDGKTPVAGIIAGYHSTDATLLGWFGGPCLVPSPDVRYFGIELEVKPSVKSQENVRIIAEEDLKTLGSWTALQYDGSVADGCEIVSAPHTLAALRVRLTDPSWKHAMRRVRSWEHTCCGLHVHVSKAGTSSTQRALMQTFTELSAHSRFLTALAGREANDYCERVTNRSERYAAVNLTPSETIEFRLFKGNTYAEHILRCVEFADALLEYTAHLNSTGGTLSLEDFAAQVYVRSDRWPVLSAWMASQDADVCPQPPALGPIYLPLLAGLAPWGFSAMHNLQTSF